MENDFCEQRVFHGLFVNMNFCFTTKCDFIVLSQVNETLIVNIFINGK